MTGIMKAQIALIPLAIGAVRLTQGRILRSCRSAAAAVIHAVSSSRALVDADDHHPSRHRYLRTVR
jgi:hypothetical protein